MEIIQLNLKHFGRFTDYRQELHAGVNIISGANETGKSTLHAFIRAMLYGITRNRSKNLDEYQLREPWENPAHFAGSLKLLYEGKVYRIDRNFHKGDEKVEVVCETDGTVASDPLAAIRYFTGGLSEADFDNTVFIRQAQPAAGVQLSASLRDYLVNREQTADESLDVSASLDYLKKKRRKIESEKQSRLTAIEDEIREKTHEAEYVNRDLERLLEKRTNDTDGADMPASFERVRDDAPGSGVENAQGSGADPAGGSALNSSENTTNGASASSKVNLAGGASANSSDPAGGAAPNSSENTTNGASGSSKENPAGGASANGPDPAGRTNAVSGTDPATGANVINGGNPENGMDPEDDADDADERVETGGVLLPVMVLLSFAAAGLMCACAFLSSDRWIRYLTGAGAVLTGLVAALLLWRVLHPISKSERVMRKLKREAFLDRTLGFREDPADPADRAERMRREMRAQEAIRRAREEEAQKERIREEEKRAQIEKALEIQEKEDMEQRGRDVARIARSQVLGKEIALRREKLDAIRERLEELYQKKAALASYDEEIRAIDLAQSRIKELSGSIYHESGAQFARQVSILLSHLTGGRYTRISLDEKMLVRLNTPDRLLSLEQVSYGTMQQVYFALRLAAAGLLSEGANVPIILDEPFSMYDDERLKRALQFLSTTSRQVILFTCQTRELDILSRIEER